MIKTHMTLLRVSAIAVTLMVSACSAQKTKSSPSCPVPDGVHCLSTTEVYQRTNTADHLSKSSGKGNAPQTQPTAAAPTEPTRANRAPVSVFGTAVRGDTLALQLPAAQSSAPAIASGEPYRQPAKVMRIYVTAWEDERGDLHMPGHIYSEIEPRRWSMGDKVPTSNDTYRLLESSGEQAAQDARATASANAGAGRPGNPGNPPVKPKE